MAFEDVTEGTYLTEHERETRERFVKEYVTDYDPLGAAIRIGYQEAYARSFSAQFMNEPYVRQLIAAHEKEVGEETEAEKHKRIIVASLYRIVNSRNAPASAQVAALGKLTSIFNLDAPVKTISEVTVKEGPDVSHLSVEELEALKKTLYGHKATASAA